MRLQNSEYPCHYIYFWLWSFTPDFLFQCSWRSRVKNSPPLKYPSFSVPRAKIFIQSPWLLSSWFAPFQELRDRKSISALALVIGAQHDDADVCFLRALGSDFNKMPAESFLRATFEICPTVCLSAYWKQQCHVHSSEREQTTFFTLNSAALRSCKWKVWSVGEFSDWLRRWSCPALFTGACECALIQFPHVASANLIRPKTVETSCRRSPIY